MKLKLASPELKLATKIVKVKTKRFMNKHKDAIVVGGAMAVTSVVAYALGHEQGCKDRDTTFMKCNQGSINTLASIKAGRMIDDYKSEFNSDLKEIAKNMSDCVDDIDEIIIRHFIEE